MSSIKETFNTQKNRPVTLHLGAVAAVLLFGTLVSLFFTDGFLALVAGLALVALNLLWGFKLFGDHVQTVKQLKATGGLNGDNVANLAKTKVPVPLGYVVTLSAAALFPLVWAIAMFALKAALIIGGVALLVIGGLVAYKHFTAGKNNDNGPVV